MSDDNITSLVVKYVIVLTFAHTFHNYAADDDVPACRGGWDPTVMGIGSVPSTKKLLKRTGMKLSDFDISEVNEAFACVVLYWVREMGATPADVAKINPYGGSVAIGTRWE